MHYRAPQIPHAVAVMVLGLDFYIQNTDGMGGTVNILLFPYLSPSDGSKAVIMVWIWDAILG